MLNKTLIIPLWDGIWMGGTLRIQNFKTLRTQFSFKIQNYLIKGSSDLCYGEICWTKLGFPILRWKLLGRYPQFLCFLGIKNHKNVKKAKKNLKKPFAHLFFPLNWKFVRNGLKTRSFGFVWGTLRTPNFKIQKLYLTEVPSDLFHG
jgi:hypothetical protein